MGRGKKHKQAKRSERTPNYDDLELILKVKCRYIR